MLAAMRIHPAVFESGDFSSFDRGLERVQSIPEFLNLTPAQFAISYRRRYIALSNARTLLLKGVFIVARPRPIPETTYTKDRRRLGLLLSEIRYTGMARSEILYPALEQGGLEITYIFPLI